MTFQPISSRAPVALFVYARPVHTQRTIKALADNRGAAETDLIIYCDGARDSTDFDDIEQTRQIAETSEGFRSVTLVRRSKNFGLAANIIDGVSKTVSQYGKVIVLEDDIVTAPGFLDYMNEALDKYSSQKSVWHISGWNYPIDTDGIGDAFFVRIMNCWGWATWDDRWKHFERDPATLPSKFDSRDRSRFNVDDAHDFFAQIEANKAGRIKTWAIFWYAAIFRQKGLCLNPSRSLVTNIGHDGTGENCGVAEGEQMPPAHTASFILPENIIEDPIAFQRIKRHLRIPLHRRIFARLVRPLRGSSR